MIENTGPDERNEARGVLFGLAIGDALGRPTEFMTLDSIKEVYGPRGIKDLPEPALYTDDTQMSLAITEALARAGNEGLETIMGEVGAEFVKWLHSPENNRAPGRTCLEGVRNLEKGIHWTKSGSRRSKGCGSAMRSAPVGYLYQHDPAKLREVASATGICTHGHPTADAACIGAAYLVKLALDRVDPHNMTGELLSFTAGISKEFDQAIKMVEEVLPWDDEERALGELGEGWVGEEAVALALYCFLRYPDSYEKTVLRGANTNGDSDSIACIAGSVSGAYLGVDAIPAAWIRKIEKSDHLARVAENLRVIKEESLNANK